MSDHDGNALGNMAAGDLGLDDKCGKLTAYGLAEAGRGEPPEPLAKFRVQHVGRLLVLYPLDEAAEVLLGLGAGALRVNGHVELRRVGAADGSPGSATEAGRESGWDAR